MQAPFREHSETGNENVIYKLWFKYFPYWPLFVILLITCIAATWLYLRYTIPLYESSAVIMIRDEKKEFEDEGTIESLDILATKKIIDNEIEVLGARSLMIEVVKKLHLYAPVSEEGIVSYPAYRSSPVRVEALHPDSVTEVSKVYFSIDANTNKVVLEDIGYPLDKWVTTKYGTLRFVRNNNNDPEKRFFFSLVKPKKITQKLVSNLNVTSAGKLSTVINLNIRDEVPQRGEDVLNGLVAEYTRAAINDKNALAENTVAFVEERLENLEQELDSIQYKIQKYKSEKGDLNISARGKMFLQNVRDNDEKLNEIDIQLAVLYQVKNYVLARDDAGGIVPSTVGIKDSLLAESLDKLFVFERKYTKLKNTTAEKNPLLVSITAQISKIKSGILDNVKSTLNNLEESRDKLTENNGVYTSMLKFIPLKEREVIELVRAEKIRTTIYTFLQQKREEAVLSSSSAVADSRVVDEAESSAMPVSPDKALCYVTAILAALILAIGIVTAKEMINLTVLFRSELERSTNIPIIGEIMFERSKTPIITEQADNTFIVEQFRRVRAALPHLGISGRRKKILVTSSISGEGKSFVAANLALSLATTGKKCVLVEFDFCNPTLEDILSQYQKTGVADYLKGGVEPEQIIKRTTINDNLFFVSCGDLPANSSELIMGSRAGELLSYLDGIFDYVVVDSPPTGSSSDAITLSPLCDATLYVVRHKFTPKVFMQRIDTSNQLTGLQNMAIIFNGVHSRGFRKNNYGYGFGYGYEHNHASRQKLNKQSKIPA
ncbi:MAG: polysaccharide biosynthesis tyrosine autokinase [Chitinophagaceae bacterium]